ncbi:MAG: polysaccharide deacetylase family protein [Bacteroidota bacterium]|nr:polysaccharide deacetylase family protein [Bacteroidota bacterium]
MIIYSSTITNRLRYICDFIGTELVGKPFQLTDRKEEFQDFPGPRINYSAEKLTVGECWLQPHTLLFEQGIQLQPIECFEVNGQKAFFKTDGDFEFDLFAASFYLLSRYEEYLPHEKDMYGRYAHENSLAFREGFLNIPLINAWLEDMKRLLQSKFPNFIPQRINFKLLPTYDIDEAWSYKHKEWWRSAGAAVKDLLKGKWHKFSLRRKVMDNQVKDPYDSYDWLNNLHLPTAIKPIYFFLVPGKTGRYDKNILPAQKPLQSLIRQHAEKYSIGIHPSWQSGDDPLLIKKEIQTLEQITTLKISSSRQHFIRFTLPHTFRHLEAAGITDDFSMGYGTINGFRASVASSFYWYNLEKEAATSLLIHPFCFMEANSFFEQHFSARQALEEMRQYYQQVKKVNGTLITIWHNSFLGTDERFKGWKEAYYQFIQEVAG